MNVQFINPFISSIKNVISTMAMIELEVQKPILKTKSLAPADIAGLITMFSPQTKGSLAIVLEKQLAFTVMKNMLGEEVSHIDEQVEDMIGELTNMICGGAKAELSQKGFEFEMAIPEIMHGRFYDIQHKVDAPVILLEFISSEGKAFLEVSFDN